MLIFCNTQTTDERQYFSVMKKRITWNSVQTWVTKIVNHHDTLAALICLFGVSHLHTAQKPESECYITDRFIGAIAQYSEYCALLAVVGRLHIRRVQTQRIHIN